MEYTGKYLNISVNGYINDVKDIIEKYKVDLTQEDKDNGIKPATCTTISTRQASKVLTSPVNSYLGAGFSAAGAYNCVYAADDAG